MLAAYSSLLLLSEHEFLVDHPEVGQLEGYVSFYRAVHTFSADGGPQADALRAAVELVIAADYRHTIEDRSIWNDPVSEEFVNANDQRLLREIVTRHARPDPDELAKARQELKVVNAVIFALGWKPDDYAVLMSGPVGFLLMATALMAILVVLPSLTCAALFGNTPLPRALDIDLVTNRGDPVSRPRRLLRHATFWAIALLAMSLLIVSTTSAVRVS